MCRGGGRRGWGGEDERETEAETERERNRERLKRPRLERSCQRCQTKRVIVVCF